MKYKQALLLLSGLLYLTPVQAERIVTGSGTVVFSQIANGDHSTTWVRSDQSAPKYPEQMARNGWVGCGVFNVSINAEGRVEEVSVVSAIPGNHQIRPAVRVIKSWRWSVAEGKTAQAEEQLVRLDFCRAKASPEQVEVACQQQSQFACE